MLLNHIKIAFRNLFRQKFYSFINVAGLGLGITCFLFILMFVGHELSYDRYHEKADQIYRVNALGLLNGMEFNDATVPSPLAQAMADEFPEVLAGTRIFSYVNQLVSFDEVSFLEEAFAFADPNLFEVFSFNLVQGNPATVLSEPNKVAISQTLADKYFFDQDPIGKIVKRQDGSSYEISGVFEDMPSNSHFKFDMFASFVTLDESSNGIWFSFNYFTYVVLQEATDVAALEAKIPDFVDKFMGPQAEELLGKSMKEMEEEGTSIGFYLSPMTDIHLRSNPGQDNQLGTNGDINYVYIFSIIGIFILVIACINFMNLATARSASRAKEVGVRKVMGAYRGQLIGQFLAESVLISFLALGLALAIIPTVMSNFNDLAGKEFDMSYIYRPEVLGGMAGVLIFVGLLSGAYPAFFLSAFQPAAVLKGSFRSGKSKSRLRSVLVVFQFATTIILIVGTAVVFKQLNYIQNKRLGFDKEQVLIVEDVNLLGEKIQPFKEKLGQYPEIAISTVTGYLPVRSWRNNNAVFPGRQIDTEKMKLLQTWRVDHDYLKTMKIKLVEGRDFNPEFLTDSSATIINQAAAELFGYGSPLNQEISRLEGPEELGTYKIIGVVEDFHYESLKQDIGPLLMLLGQTDGFAAIRMSTDDLDKAIGLVKTTWEEMAPGQPFNYVFMDERFDNTYQAEKRIGQIVGVFSSLAIIIACLGLFGLAAFTAEQRTKEIGVRKVLGASVGNIVFLLSKEFSKLVLISFVLAIPVAWHFMNTWLQDFKFRTDLGWEVFVLAGLLAIAIAWITISFQSVRAALMNPVEALRDE